MMRKVVLQSLFPINIGIKINKENYKNHLTSHRNHAALNFVMGIKIIE